MNDCKRIRVVSRRIQSRRKAIQAGFSRAQNHGVQLYLSHSIHNHFGRKGWNIVALSLEKEYEKILEKARQELSKWVEVEKKGMMIQELVRAEGPTKEILKTIDEEKVNLLLRLAHKEGWLEDLFFRA